MGSPLDARIVCSRLEDIVAVLNRIVVTLDANDRKRFSRVRSRILHESGIEGMHARMNNRTVREILEFEADEPPDSPLIAGERDGIKYAVYPAPDEAKRDDSSQDEGTD